MKQGNQINSFQRKKKKGGKKTNENVMWLYFSQVLCVLPFSCFMPNVFSK